MTPEDAHSEFRQKLEGLALSLPRYNRSALIARACQQHNQRQRAQAARLNDLYAEIATVSPRSHPNLLARVCVNYLRQLLEARYPELTGLRGDSSKFELYALAKSRMLQLIEQNYPWLAEECQRQQY